MAKFGRYLVACFAVALLLPPPASAVERDSFTTILQPAMKQHCAKCHGADEELEGDLNLLELRSTSDLLQDVELTRKLIDVLDQTEMPPEEEPPLAPKLREQLVAELNTILHASLAKQKTYPRTPLRRMNRFQYNNAVQDLFQLNCIVLTLPERMLREHGGYFQPASGKMPEKVSVGSRPLGKSQLIERRLAGVAAFPQDLRAEHGFDNRGDHLSLSPLLLESFLNLSRSVVESPDFGPQSCGIWKTFFVEPVADVDLPTEVRNRLRRFLTNAFRRPVDEGLLDRYTSHVLTRIEAGESFTESMKGVASAAIASPKFLYLYDRVSSTAAEPLDDFELASRLSFFLWGSIPDETLLDLAAAGKLSDRVVLATQVDRMLNDRRLKRFCDSFPSQWLQLERIVSSVPNRQHFPDFYFSKYRSSMHMMLEPLLLFETILIEDRSILQLVDSDFSYRSGRLNGLYYGVEGNGGAKGNRTQVGQIPFTRVKLNDRRQGGIVTNVAVMTMTSGTERTKPITRGAWLATVIFNDPPKPPPADVPPLAEEPSEAEEHLTLRERLLAHRERADCAGCHEKIDPLGFALENFGPTGKWRDKYENNRDVDMQGKLFRTHEFNNIVEFKDAILAEKDRFTRAFGGHLLSFALARGLSAADSLALDKIANQAKADDYRMRALIKHVVMSEPFLHKSNPQVIAPATPEKSPAREKILP